MYTTNWMLGLFDSLYLLASLLSGFTQFGLSYRIHVLVATTGMLASAGGRRSQCFISSQQPSKTEDSDEHLS